MKPETRKVQKPEVHPLSAQSSVWYEIAMQMLIRSQTHTIAYESLTTRFFYFFLSERGIPFLLKKF